MKGALPLSYHLAFSWRYRQLKHALQGGRRGDERWTHLLLPPLFFCDFMVGCRWKRPLWLVYLLFRSLSFPSSSALHALTTFADVQPDSACTRLVLLRSPYWLPDIGDFCIFLSPTLLIACSCNPTFRDEMGALPLSSHLIGGIINSNTLSKVAGEAMKGGFFFFPFFFYDLLLPL